MSERTHFYTIFITNLLHSVFICYYLLLWHTSTTILGNFQGAINVIDVRILFGNLSGRDGFYASHLCYTRVLCGRNM